MIEWYLGDNWDGEAQKLFEQKLKKSRGAYNKAQYLRIKGSSLLKSKESFKRAAGCELLRRVINEYSGEISNVMFAYEQLGDYYYSTGEYDKAEINYRESISFYKIHGRGGTSGIGDIKLAETVFSAGKVDKFSEIYHLLTNEFHQTEGKLILNDDIFRYYSVLAKISFVLDKKEQAKEYAKKALQLSAINEPQLDKYPEMGIVKVSDHDLAILSDILKSN